MEASSPSTGRRGPGPPLARNDRDRQHRDAGSHRSGPTSRPLRIGELAAELGLNPKTIRYYEGVGLMPPAQRSAARYRLYGPEDGARLRFIGKAKAIGLSLREIREVLTLRDQGRRPCEHVIAVLDRRLAAIDSQLRALEAFRAELAGLRSSAARTMDVDACVCGIIEASPARGGPERRGR